jgi:anti-sigma regulatory factor (Ser/Thr protein kinase)
MAALEAPSLRGYPPEDASRLNIGSVLGVPRPADGSPPVPEPPEHHEAELGGEWQLRDFLELGALPGAVPCARLHARMVLWEWRLSRLGESTELVVSELMTNAVAAAQATDEYFPVRLWLLSDQVRLLVMVWDANQQPPVIMDVGEEDESGRGLILVDTVAARWDWYDTPHRAGKTVWAICEK